MLVTLLGIVNDVRPVQPSNAELPMLVTLLGISMDVRLLQSSNAPSPMLVTLLGIVVFLQPVIKEFDTFSIIALQLFRESYLGFLSSTFIELNPLQPENADWPMSEMLLGIVNAFRPLHPENARMPIVVTLLGMVIEVRAVQP